MKKILENPVLLFASRFLLGMVFVVAAIGKINQPETFASALEAYEMTPVALVNIFAIVLPWLELMCGIFLIGGVYVRSAAALLGALLVVFILAVSAAILRGLNINCGCFGETGGSPVGWDKVLENAALLMAAWHLIRYGESHRVGNRTPGMKPAEDVFR